MTNKPELIIFSYYLMGGSASLFRNLLTNSTNDYFNIKLINLKYDWTDQIPPLVDDFIKSSIILDAKMLDHYGRHLQFKGLFNEKAGLVVCSDTNELISLKFYKNLKKNICFICHDDVYIEATIKFANIITVIITHNYSIYTTLKSRLPNSDIYFMYHGVKAINFEKNLNLTEDLKLVFLARHTKSKGIYDLITIDDLLARKGIAVNWTILGDGPERAGFTQLVKDRSNFSFLTPKTNEQVIEVLKNRDILIHPSRSDGLPVAILEAMSAGCVPIVSKFNEGIKKVVVDDVNGFVEEIGDFESVANRIIFLHENRQLLHTMAEANKSRVLEDFNIEVQAKKYFNIFEKYNRYPLKKMQTWNLTAHIFYRFYPHLIKLYKFIPPAIASYLKSRLKIYKHLVQSI
jgi:glycosyltransferase involved in cell wall biosynthesis